MMCDFIIAADNAKFGQPEIKLGVMPGRRRHPAPDRASSASRRRWTSCLTGRMMDAAEAERCGLVEPRGARSPIS